MTVRRLGAFLLVLALAAAALPARGASGVGAAAPGGVGGAEGAVGDAGTGGARRSAYDELRQARAAEEALQEELVQVGLRLAAAQGRLEELARREAAAQAELAAAEARRAETARRLAEQRRRVAAWFRFLQEEGMPGFLDVLLGARDFADFVSRLEVVSDLVRANARRLRRLRDLHEEARRQGEELAARQRRLADLLASEQAEVGGLRRLRAEREAALARARALVGERAAAMERLDRQWSRDAPLLTGFLRRFGELPWERVRPQRVVLTAAGLVIEIGEAELNRALAAGQGVALRLVPGRVLIVPADGGAEDRFRLAAGLEARGGRLALVPAALEVLGVPVGEEALREVVAGYDLTLDSARFGVALPVRAVAVESGRLRIRVGGAPSTP